jgi:Predicted membrane protein involved in D-alanine export
MQYAPFVPYWPPMHLTSLSFLYVFLPFSLAIYYMVPVRRRAAALLVISLVYLMLSQPGAILLMLCSVLIDYLLARAISHPDTPPLLRMLCLAGGIVKNTCLFFYACAQIGSPRYPALLGLRIYSLSGIDALLCFYKGERRCPKHPLPFFLYALFFPRLYCGPLEPYENFSPQIAEIHPSAGLMATGLRVYLIGVVKQVLLGARLGQIYSSASALAAEQSTVLSCWIMVISLALYTYFMFSGYADIAQGLGNLFGLSMPGQFYYPYQSHSIHNFFDRFLMTFTDFIKRRVCAPLTHRFPSRAMDGATLLLAGVLLGSWFGLTANTLLWGLCIGVFLVLERYAYPQLLKEIPALFRRLATLAIVFGSFSLLCTSTLQESRALFSGMVFLSSLDFFNNTILYIASSNRLLLLAAGISCISAGKLLLDWLSQSAPRLARALLAGATCLLFFLATATQL